VCGQSGGLRSGAERSGTKRSVIPQSPLSLVGDKGIDNWLVVGWRIIYYL
jgi:hypothetical protein